MLARLRVEELPATKLAGPVFGLAPVRILARWSIFDTSLLPDSCARALPSSSLPSSFALSRGGSRKVRRGAAPGGSQSRGDFADDVLSSSAAAPPPLSARGARHPRPHSIRAMESRGAETSRAAILAESMQRILAARRQAEVAAAAENAGGAFSLNTTGAAGRGLGLAPEDGRTRVAAAAAGAGGAFGFGSGASGFAFGRASFGSLTGSDQRPGLLRREQDRQQDRLRQQREQGQRLIQQQVGSSPWFQLWWHSVSSSGVVCRQAQRLQGSDRISVR